MSSIYLDHAAGAPLADGVREAMQEAAEVGWANPSSVHADGRDAKRLLERAREQVAAAIGARPADVVFTSGGSEACCVGIHGLFSALRTAKESSVERTMVTSMIEHPAVSESLAVLETREANSSVTHLGLHDAVPESASPSLLACQWINHETGVVLPVETWAEQVKRRGGLAFVDASQALGKLSIDVSSGAFDAVAFGSAKVGGPTGSGALWLRRGLDIEPLMRGGGQERARRGGTQNVLGAVGFGAACATLDDQLAQMSRLGALRDVLEAGLARQVAARVNGAEWRRCPTISNLWFEGVMSQRLVAALDLEGVRVSAGSACSAGIAEPSPVLSALYPDAPGRGGESIRFSLGPSTRKRDIEQTISVVISVLSRFKT